MTRPTGNKLLEELAEGMIDKDALILAFVGWLTDEDLRDMLNANDIMLETERDEEEDT